MVQTKKVALVAIFIFCLVVQIIPVIRSGTDIGNGFGFWGPNGHDGIWHLSLINHISSPVNINMPIFSGEKLKNYHPFFDVLVAYLANLTRIPSSLILFQIFPVLSAFFYLVFSYKVGSLIIGSKKGGIILMLLNTLNNSFGWVIHLIKDHNLEGESLFWSMQSPSNQLNPPFALSLVMLLILIYILNSRKQLSKKDILSVSLILIFLPVIKAYSAIPAFIIFFFYILKTKKHLKLLLVSLFLSIILFLQFNKNSSSLLIWQPLWFIRSLFESTDKLYFRRFALLAQTHGLKLFIFYLIGVPIFFIGNFAFRLLGLKKLVYTNTWLFRSLLFSILILSLIPLLFIQSGTGWNTIQFLYYAIFLLNIPLASYLAQTKSFIPILIIVVQIPPLLSSLPQYLGKNPPAYLPDSEINCLNFLKQQPPSNILTYPYDEHIKDKLTAPFPLYAYTTTSYVSAYSKNTTYLEDEMNLANSGYDWQPRHQNAQKFFDQENLFQDRGFLLNNQIDYIYLAGEQVNKTHLDLQGLSLKSVYQNSDCQVFKVIK